MHITRRHALRVLAGAPPLAFGLATTGCIPQTQQGQQKGSSAMIRLAMLSFWHVHARDYLRQAQSNPSTEIVAVWDEDAERGRAQADALHVPFYGRLGEVLARSEIDGVIVDTPTTMHHEVMLAAAQSGKHIFTEKVIAPTRREANEVVAAVRKAGVKLMISLPRLYAGYTLAIKDIIDRQLLGQPTQVRVRVTHDGALKTPQHPQGWLPSYFFDPKQTAGGAMIDLGAHPMYLARLFLGLPESVSASYGYVTGRAVEDNALAALSYPQGTIALAETSFVNPFSPFTIEVHGTEGSLLYGTPDAKVLVRSQKAGPSADHWSEWSSIPPDQPLPFHQWVAHIERGTTATENIQIALDLSALMEAANRSAQTKRPVRLDELGH